MEPRRRRPRPRVLDPEWRVNAWHRRELYGETRFLLATVVVRAPSEHRARAVAANVLELTPAEWTAGSRPNVVLQADPIAWQPSSPVPLQESR